jgi:hypothetical protein
MQILQIIDFNYDANFLIINHSSISYLESKKILKSIFKEVHNKPYKKGFFSNLFLVFLIIFYRFIKIRNKIDLFVTPEHSIDYHNYLYFRKASEINLIEDGNMTYIDNLEKNDYYLMKKSPKVFLKKIFRIFGILNYKDKRITEFYLLDKNKINQTKFLANIKNYYKEIDIYKNRQINNVITLYDLYNSLFVFDYEKIIGEKSIIFLTQPLLEDKVINKDQEKMIMNLFKKESLNYDFVYIKLHPRIKNISKYQNLGKVILIPGSIPFEMFIVNKIRFKKGFTYNSSAINYNCFDMKIILKEYEI